MTETRIACVADVHLANHRRFGGVVEAGLNRRCRQVAGVLRRAAEHARVNEASALVVLGDLFDTCKPEPQVIAAAMEAMDAGPATKILLCGNHDANSDTPGDHALAPFAHVPGYIVVDHPQVIRIGGIDLLCVPHRPGNASEWLPGVVGSLLHQPAGEDASESNPLRRVPALHLGLRDEATPHYLAASPGSYDVAALASLCAELGIDTALAGDWHVGRTWTTYPSPEAPVTIAQVGALAPTGFDNPGMDGYGRVATVEVTDTSTAVVMREIPGPRFVTVRDLREARRAAEQRGDHGLYLNWVVQSANDLASAAATLREAIEAGALVDAEASVDGARLRAVASQAAQEARSADTLSEALASFVKSMSLPMGVTAEEVLERVNRYLGVQS